MEQQLGLRGNRRFIGKITGIHNGDATITASLGYFTASADITVYGGTEAVKGDVTGDGQVTLEDAIYIQMVPMEMLELTGQALENADLDGDDEIGILDAIIAQKMALKML